MKAAAKIQLCESTSTALGHSHSTAWRDLLSRNLVLFPSSAYCSSGQKHLLEVVPDPLSPTHDRSQDHGCPPPPTHNRAPRQLCLAPGVPGQGSCTAAGGWHRGHARGQMLWQQRIHSLSRWLPRAILSTLSGTVVTRLHHLIKCLPHHRARCRIPARGCANSTGLS